ncbi:MAG TPA: type I 3-dehydroquinate dehydratase, partial [Pyrinomonadaceae bacterium]|nr:type I 3-dehydroquinate dehydratase [Pyrinomonadaceae bacterium]
MTTEHNVRLCVPVCVRRADELRAAFTRAAESGDLVELRLDCLEDDAQLEHAMRELHALIGSRAQDVILTLRPPEQGGSRELDAARRLRFWSENFSPGSEVAAYADLELDLVALLEVRERGGARRLINWNKVICSHHDFACASDDLESIFTRMLGTPARILKLAVRARDITDCLAIFRLLERARSAGREMIAVAMGEAGLVTRILAPSRGAFLTYGALTREQATAPGQVTAADLRELYRLHTIDARTEVFGLVGSPVAHSLSPHMHNAAFGARGLNAVYVPFDVSDVSAFVRRMARPETRELQWNLRGFSVTAPHKSAIVGQLDWVEPPAVEMGAVNTVVVEGSELRGYNTDALAALAPLEGLLELEGARVAVVG